MFSLFVQQQPEIQHKSLSSLLQVSRAFPSSTLYNCFIQWCSFKSCLLWGFFPFFYLIKSIRNVFLFLNDYYAKALWKKPWSCPVTKNSSPKLALTFVLLFTLFRFKPWLPQQRVPSVLIYVLCVIIVQGQWFFENHICYGETAKRNREGKSSCEVAHSKSAGNLPSHSRSFLNKKNLFLAHNETDIFGILNRHSLSRFSANVNVKRFCITVLEAITTCGIIWALRHRANLPMQRCNSIEIFLFCYETWI